MRQKGAEVRKALDMNDMNKNSTLKDLREAFPCKELNAYYWNNYYSDFFYEYNPKKVNEKGKQSLNFTAGKHKGGRSLARWDFNLNEDLLLPIENGNKMAMSVKMWRKGNFDRLKKSVEKKYPGIEIAEF